MWFRPLPVSLAALLVPALAAGGLLLCEPSSSAASAASTCHGSTCTGKDPQTYGCSTGATTIDSMTLRYGGTYELRYSTRCEAGWVRYTGDSQDEYDAVGIIEGGYIERSIFHLQKKYTGKRTESTTWTVMISGTYALRMCGETLFGSEVLVPETCHPAH